MPMNLRGILPMFAIGVLALSACAPMSDEPSAAGGESAQSPAVSAEIIPREEIFGNPVRTQGRISPDGGYVSWLAPVDGVMNVWVAPASSPDKGRAITREKARGLQQHFWAPDGEHVLYIQDQGGNENFHVYAVNVATGRSRDLTPVHEEARATVEGISRLRPDVVLVGLNDRDARLFDLYEVDYRTGERTLVAENPGYGQWVVDNRLQARLAMQQVEGGGSQVFRRTDDGGWEEAFTIGNDDFFTTNPVGFGAEGDNLYWLDSRGRDRAALVRMDVASGTTEVMATSEQADIGDVLIDPRTFEPVGYAVNYLRKEWTPLNDEFAADLRFLRGRLEGELEFASVTDDAGEAVVHVGAAEQPGTYYLYDRSERTLTRMFDTRPDLADYELQPMHPVVIRSRDSLDLVSYLTLPPGSDPDANGRPDNPVPMVLYVHGGPWARNEYGYHPTHQWLSNRGYAVLSVNYRGSTGFGKDFVNAAIGEWSGQMHDDLIDAVEWAIDDGVTSPDSVAIMGGSYGGYATLVGVTFTPEQFACGVDIVGPSNLATLMESFPEYWRPILEGTFYRHIGDPADAEMRERIMAQSPITRVDQISVPLLIGQGANDPRVVKAESDQIVDAMREQGLPVTYVLYPDEGHGFVRPENRLSFYAVSEAFLSECLGGRYEPVGDDFSGSSIEVLEGAEHVPGLRQALAR